MTGTPLWLLAGLWGGAALVVGLGVFFARQQNRGAKLGGAISRAKQVWLIWAVYAWFVAAPLTALVPGFEDRLRQVLAVFAVGMWLRGAVELFMLYVTKNWRPPLGIAHDVACVGFLMAGLVWVFVGGAAPRTGLGAWGVVWTGVLAVSLVLETYYAAAFHRAVQGRTTGVDGVWFASADEPRFARINRVTAWANGPLILFILAFLLALSLPSLAFSQPELADEGEGWSGPGHVQLNLRHHDRPLSMPHDVFDIFFDGGLSQVAVRTVVASLGAGVRYGVDDHLEVGLRLIRLTLSDLPDTGIDRPTAFAMYRLGGGIFEAAARLETELPTGGGGLQFWLQFPMLLRAGPYVRLDLKPVISAQSGDTWQWGASAPLEVWGQLTQRLRVFAAVEVGSPDLRRADDLLLRPEAGLAWAFGRSGPSFEVIARVSAPSVVMIGQRPVDPAFGNYVGGMVTVRAFFQGPAEDPNEALF